MSILESNCQTKETIEKTKINCDKVAWLNSALDRYLQNIQSSLSTGISRTKEANRLAALLEIMDILNLEFENCSAALNAISAFTELNILTAETYNPVRKDYADKEIDLDTNRPAITDT